MKSGLLHGQNGLEIGVAVFALAVAAAVVSMIAGRAMTRVRRVRGHFQSPPSRGGVPDERHRNVAVVAAR